MNGFVGVCRLALAQDSPDVDAEAAEIGVFSYSYDVNTILFQMQKTLATLLASLMDLGRLLECEESVVERVKEGLESHLASCKEAVAVVISSRIMAGAPTKAALALLVHRPLLFRVKAQNMSDFHVLLEAANK
jgi:hypothetical protein